MRSIPFVLAGALALVSGCGSSVEQDLFEDGSGGSGGSGASGASGSTESTGTPAGVGGGTSGSATASGGATSGVATGSGAGSGSTTTGSGPTSGSGAGTSTGSGSGPSGSTSSVGVSSGSGPGPASAVAVSAVASSGSGGGTCNHDVCEWGEPLDPFCSECTLKVCQIDPSCCDSWWHEGCVYFAGEDCGCMGGDCVTCSEFVNGDPGPICQQSEPLVDQLLGCVCNYGCPYECTDACMGFGTTPECQDCVLSLCYFELDMCLNDF